jgi:predicted NBD/HSP70 family sugar kinase
VPLASISAKLGIPTVLENDANCGAVGNTVWRGSRLSAPALQTISTGIGGIIINNELYAGASGAAGEWAISSFRRGPSCGAGHAAPRRTHRHRDRISRAR